jgi:hypothetical protein
MGAHEKVEEVIFLRKAFERGKAVAEMVRSANQ